VCINRPENTRLNYPLQRTSFLEKRRIKNRAGKIGAENIKAWHQALEYQALRILTTSLPPSLKKVVHLNHKKKTFGLKSGIVAKVFRESFKS